MIEPVFHFRYDVFYKIPIQGGLTRVTVDAPDEETAKNLAEEKFLASELGKAVRWHIFDSIELLQEAEKTCNLCGQPDENIVQYKRGNTRTAVCPSCAKCLHSDEWEEA